MMIARRKFRVELSSLFLILFVFEKNIILYLALSEIPILLYIRSVDKKVKIVDLQWIYRNVLVPKVILFPKCSNDEMSNEFCI